MKRSTVTTRDDGVDVYRGCEAGRCYHDLAKGILTEDLQTDGPYAQSVFDKQGTGPLAQALRVARNREGRADDGSNTESN